ncbi:hypothetical protein [Alkalihalobacillus sp. LMS39]|uniref:hypothetical protein n=1 Tax=Alkalihalobacillus sp. LMS39 TaxID=2924032 RepID=UPI001FB378F2|nr:hypothetical protein [Alkalihalobacillus sp. LMS39]UOE92705.1 hypothetical protein MM271_15865 [Alkalihalobacillus sp. LMS39]
MIYFAILAHKNEEILKRQIENIQYFNPESKVVLYNGGTDKRFGNSLNINICPYSRPLKYGNLVPFMIDVMKWVEETGVTYDYFVNLDHDVLFIKHGFESFLDKMMSGYDCMGPHFLIHNTPFDYPDFGPSITMWREWQRWQPFFKTDYFARFFNPGQIYKPGIVKRMLEGVNRNRLEALLSSTEVFALEEMFFPTLAMTEGAKIRGYPWNFEQSLEFVRHLGNITKDEVRKAREQPFYYWIHPIKEEKLEEMSQWILELES